MNRTKFHVVMLLIHASCFILLLLGCSGNGGDKLTYNQLLQKKVTSMWQEYMATHGVTKGGLAVYITSPKGTYFASESIDGSSSRNIHFRAASNTKTFTAASIMLLHQQGLLNIDDLIVAPIPGKGIPYVPDTKAYEIPYKKTITIRQLLMHRAGVFDVSNDDVPESCQVPYAGQSYEDYIRIDLGEDNHQFTFDELVGVVATCNLSTGLPGEKYKYSNTGYSILGKIIERVSGKSYGEFVMENLVLQNAMYSTTFPYLSTDRTLPEPYAKGYLFYEGVLSEVTEDNMSAHVAEGNIISTPADLALWVRALIRGEAGISKELVDLMTCTPEENASSCYGMGILFIEGLGYGHNGAHEGYLSLMLYNPDDHVALVIFFGVLDGDHLEEQLHFINEVGSEARKVLGYKGLDMK
jgi:D-alanyl-D-alanine carboxypeptidase